MFRAQSVVNPVRRLLAAPAFLTRLLLLAVAAMLPLAGLTAYETWRQARDERARAEGVVRARAAQVVEDTTQVVTKARRLLAFLASRPEVRSSDRAACTALLRDMVQIEPAFANAGLADAGGVPVCASLSQGGQLPKSVTDRLWFQRAIASREVVVGAPITGQIVGRPTLGLAQSVFDDRGTRVGVLLVSLDLLALSNLWQRLELPPDSAVVLQDTAGRMLARHPDPQRWIGHDASRTLAAFRIANPSGQGVYEGIDGVRRVYAVLPMPALDAWVVVGIPEGAVLAPVRTVLRDGLLRLAIGLLAALVAVLALARRLAAPVEQFGRTAARVADGDIGVRADEDVPAELRAVALEFNRMLDVRAAVEHRLRESLARFELAVSTGNVWSWHDGAPGIELPAAIVESLGLQPRPPATAEDTAGAAAAHESWLDWVDERDREPLRDAVRRLVQRREPLDHEFRVRDAAGELRWLYVRGHAVWNDAGRAIELVGTVFDVTARRRTERLLHERDQQLAGIVETAMDAIITIDVGQRIRVFNEAACRMFGLEAAQAIGQPLERFIPGAARAAHAGHVRAFAGLGGPHAQRMAPRRDLRALRADGREFPIEASISRLGDGDGVLMTAVVRDLSDVHEAQHAREAQVAAEAASRAKSDFVADIGHELRTPLNALLGFVQLVGNDRVDPVSERHRRQLDHAGDAGRHLLGLIDDLLDLSRIEAGRLSVQSMPVALGAVLDAAVALSQEAARQYRVTLVPPHRDGDGDGGGSGDGDGAGPWVWGDAARLRQVLINLLSNAAKYNRPGGSVELAVSRAGERVQVDVIDNGIGMDAAQRERLFRRFDRLGREGGDVRGTGIGLVLTRQLVEHMHGTIEVESQPGRGTRVRVSLVAAQAPAEVSAGPAAPRAGNGAAPALGGRVLYIEDEPVNRLLVAEFLRGSPAVVLECAPTGAEGLSRARAQRPDLILLDRGLPDTDGLQVLAELRRDAATRDVPVVMLSASGDDTAVHDALAAGAAAYWTKPMDFGRFEAQLQAYLRAPAGPAGR